MTRINNLKARVFVAFVAIVPLIIAFQPAVTHACNLAGHCGG